VHPADLGAHVLRELMNRTGVDPSAVDDVTMGCVNQTGPQAGCIARTAPVVLTWARETGAALAKTRAGQRDHHRTHLTRSVIDPATPADASSEP